MPVSDRLPCQSSSPDRNVERMERRLTGSDAVPSKIKQPPPPPRLCAWFWCQWYLSGQATLTQKHRPSHGSACTCANQPKKPKNTRERLGQVSAQTAHMQNRRKNQKNQKNQRFEPNPAGPTFQPLDLVEIFGFFCFFCFPNCFAHFQFWAYAAGLSLPQPAWRCPNIRRCAQESGNTPCSLHLMWLTTTDRLQSKEHTWMKDH